MTKIIAISNHKGGVGKTTSTINIGAGLSQGKKGKKVLLIDLDPQANLTKCFGIKEPEVTIYDALNGSQPIVPIEITKKLHLVASIIGLANLEKELLRVNENQFILKTLLNQFKDIYDYIFIDCPPSLGILTINALTASDEVYIPIQTEYLSILGVTDFLDFMEIVRQNLNSNLKLGGVICSNYQARRQLTKHIDEEVNERFSKEIFKTKIRATVSLPESQLYGVDIFSYNPKSIGAKDYGELCKEIVKRS